MNWEPEETGPETPPDASHDLDLVPVFACDAHNAEMLALEIQSLLEAQEIPTVLVSGSQFPSLPFEVRVPRARLEEARAAIADAEQGGPEAAEQQFEAAPGSEGLE